jgi:radical SAM superfamily enzyme YgiQ (UPF0313 family)
MLHTKLVSVESGISAMGFRKIAAVAREIDPTVEVCFVPTDNLYSFSSHFFPGKNAYLGDKDIKIISQYLAKADVIGFSSMTASAAYVDKIARNIKWINPGAYIIWGGVHAELYPKESLHFVDAICTGEGELSIKLFMENLKKNQIRTDLPNMWFKTKKGIIKNIRLPLNSSELMDHFPHPYYQNDCLLYDYRKHCFKAFDKLDYAQYNGLLYRTIWTLGCPFNCSYCANDSFITMDSGYRRLRYASVEHIIDEIKIAKKLHPYISTVAFYDDNFISLPLPIIKYFSQQYKKDIGLPFVVFGIHPNTADKEKINLLARAGMNRMRMGIQSGSKDILRFFNRPTPLEKIKVSTGLLAEAAKKFHMIAPSYDIISDIPIQAPKDIKDTLELVYNINKPFTLNVFSLRIFPKTRLYDYVQMHPKLKKYFNNSSYLNTRMTFNNILLYLLATIEIPKFVFRILVNIAIDKKNATKEYPLLFKIVNFCYLSKRGIDHLMHFDFSTITGRWIYYLWAIRNLG